MKKKTLAVVGSGAAALALGAGLFAWSANTVNVGNVVAAGTSNTVVACTTDALNVVQNDATWNGSAWVIDGATVGNAGIGAGACSGMDLTLTALDSAGNTLASATDGSLSVVNGTFEVPLTLNANVDMADLDKWTVVIK